jgi:hypothetical protein
MNIINRQKSLEEDYQSELEKLIKNEPNACHASNIYRLLNKNWVEYKNAYKVKTKLTPRKTKKLESILYPSRGC